MKYLGINAAATQLGIHESTLRRWEEWELIVPERADMGKISVRIYDEDDMRVLRSAKSLMNSGVQLREAFERAHSEMTRKEAHHD